MRFPRYTPYFFDKNMLDNILEESVDQHFHSLIQTRRIQRRRDVVDDSFAAEVIEEMGDNSWEPPEVKNLNGLGLHLELYLKLCESGMCKFGQEILQLITVFSLLLIRKPLWFILESLRWLFIQFLSCQLYR